MPNWCSNSLYVEAATDEQIERITKAAQAEQLLEEFAPRDDWGCKWDIQLYDVDVSGTIAFITFGTPWSPPSETFFRRMSAALPNCALENFYEEPGCAFYGKTVAKNGWVTDDCYDMGALFNKWLEKTYDAEKVSI